MEVRPRLPIDTHFLFDISSWLNRYTYGSRWQQLTVPLRLVQEIYETGKKLNLMQKFYC